MNDKLPSLTYIIGTYPGLTTTFIDREVMVLRNMGVQLKILSIRQPWTKLSAEQEALRNDVTYLLPIKWLPLIISHIRYALTKPNPFFSTLVYLLTRPHSSFKTRLMTLIHFMEGVYAAYTLRRAPGQHLHAHFIDRAATVALVASRLLGIPYSVTAHASDIYVNPVLLREKLANAKFVSTCTAYNRSYLSQFGKDLFNHKLLCIYHGLELERYVNVQRTKLGRPVILSVGQLQERKGLSYLVDACGILQDRGIQFECRIVGEGPLRQTLQDQIHRLGLDNSVRLLGALPHEEVIAQYQEATVFALPAILGKDGDRDGIPNVILEALSMGLPVVSTAHSGIPEVIEEGTNGLLVPPEDGEALSSALARLICDPEMQIAFGKAGRQIVADRFNPEKNARRLLEAFIA
ncbi:MAG TPA: glycosyltransferase [Anaerolineales bacterium]|nr:glycosyltransferase [Anaerolineales bacterium]